jgi:putative glutamine amidotransferase
LQILLLAGKLSPLLKRCRRFEHFPQENIVLMKGQAMKKTPVLLCLVILVAASGCHSNCGSSRPLIGITSVYRIDKDNGSASTWVNFAYVEAVAENGGAPVILPTITGDEILQRYVDELDGLVLVGGADIPPSAYGQQPHETVTVMPDRRYNFDRKLIALWLAEGKPILGVCLGMQFTNVVSGGTLIQDIPSQVGTQVAHRQKYHRVRIEPNSSLAKILGAGEALVYSNHHQAVKDVGKALRVIAHSDDGIIEALERTDGEFGLFVQWHPEQMDDREHRNAIYGALVRACAAQN